MKTLLCFTLLSAFAISHALGGKCESRFTEWGAWSTGRNGALKFPVPEETIKWKVDIIFDKPVNSIDAWQGTKEKCNTSKNKCSFENENWNGNNGAGSSLELGFQKNFDDTDTPPKIEKLVFRYCSAEPCDAWTKTVVECDVDDVDDNDSGESSTSEPTNPETEAPTEGPTEPTNPETEAPTEGPTEPTENPTTANPTTTEESSNNGDPEGTCELGGDIAGATIGHITHYQAEPTGGNCDLDWDNVHTGDGWTHFAALPKSDNSDVDRYEAGANCGRCVRVKCSCEQELFDGACQSGGEETILMVVDSCPSCPYVGDIDTSTAGWNSITGNEGFSKYDGTWEFVECPSSFVSGPLQLRFKGGSSQWWYALQPVNHRNKITGMEITMNGQTKDLTFGDIDGFWWKGTDELSFPVTITVKGSEGKSASVTLNSAEDVSEHNALTLDGEL